MRRKLGRCAEAPLSSGLSLPGCTENCSLCTGCDALSVHYLLACVATSLTLGSAWQSPLGMLSIMGPWLLAHWEEYHTGVNWCLSPCKPFEKHPHLQSRISAISHVIQLEGGKLSTTWLQQTLHSTAHSNRSSMNEDLHIITNYCTPNIVHQILYRTWKAACDISRRSFHAKFMLSV